MAHADGRRGGDRGGAGAGAGADTDTDIESRAHTWTHVVAGAGAGWATAFVTCPLDVVKTRLQSSSRWHGGADSTLVTLAQIWQREGVRGMYRGLGPTLFGYLPSFSIYFPVYHACKILAATSLQTSPATDPRVHILSAVLAGTAVSLSTNPLWVVRTRLMTQHVLHDRLYAGSYDAFRSIYREEGLAGFYKGASASIVGVVHVAIQFPLYEWLKRALQPRDSDRPAHAPSPLSILAASAASKVTASTITYPHEVVRTRLQIERGNGRRGLLQAVRQIWREDGAAGFYRGLQTNIIRVIPASAVTFVTYEMILAHLGGPPV